VPADVLATIHLATRMPMRSRMMLPLNGTRRSCHRRGRRNNNWASNRRRRFAARQRQRSDNRR
jgi:hypothetical protein